MASILKLFALKQLGRELISLLIMAAGYIYMIWQKSHTQEEDQESSEETDRPLAGFRFVAPPKKGEEEEAVTYKTPETLLGPALIIVGCIFAVVIAFSAFETVIAKVIACFIIIFINLFLALIMAAFVSSLVQKIKAHKRNK